MRRVLVIIVGLLLFAGLAFGSGKTEQPKAETKEAAKTETKMEGYSEAPMLAALVKAGKLPALDERLPKEPQVVEPVDEIGQYGGTWRRVATRAMDNRLSDRMGYEPIVRRARDATSVIPGIAKSWEVLDGGRTYVFYLREGMKWSDGDTFDADDLVWMYDEVWTNEELTPSFPTWLKVFEEKVTVEKVSDYAVKYSFPSPNGLFLEIVTFRGPYMFTASHYMKQFHPNYADKNDLAKMVKEKEFEFWYQLYLDRNDIRGNPEAPTIRSWKLMTELPATRVVAERNPYYWKVDPQGQQLPYIDKVVYDMVESGEIANFKAMAGEIDMISRYMAFGNYTLFMENADKGDYEVYLWKNPGSDVLNLNLTYADPMMRKLFQTKNFRLALSYAINRKEIADIAYLGVGEPWQALPVEEDPFFVPPKYLDQDVNKANQLLDEMGLSKKGSDGFRLGPDGKTLALAIESYGSEEAGGASDGLELVKEYWQKVGIKTSLKFEDRSLWTARRAAGEIQVAAYLTAGIHWAVDANWFIPMWTGNAWAPEYAKWYESGGKAGEEPIPEIKELQDLFDKMTGTADEAERTRIGKQIIRSHVENVWIIGLVRYPAIAIVKNNFKNVPRDAIQSWRLMTPGYTNPEQYFFKK